MSHQSPYSIIVVELDDVVPRRSSDHPNLYVGVTTFSLSDCYERLTAGVDPSWVSPHIVRLRTELCQDSVTSSAKSAENRSRALISRLRSSGYTVNRLTTTWRVYVLELDPAATPDPGKGFLYVGETSLPVEERVAQHLSGARTKNDKASLSVKVVRDHFMRIAAELAPGQDFFSKAASLEAETRWAEDLRKRGYTVAGGH